MKYRNLAEAVAVIRKQLPLVAVVVGVLTGVVALILQRSLISAGLALGLGVLLALITGFTLKQGNANPGMQMAFLGLDYLVKVIILISTLLIARKVAVLDQHVLGISLAVSILGQSFVQARNLARIQAPILTPVKDAQIMNQHEESN